MNNSKFQTFYFCTFTFCLFIVIYITFAAFQPGVYTIDSADQLKQALTDNYADWHPPMMAWLWSILIKITKHFESLLIFHLLLLFFGAWYWGRILKQFGLIYFTLIIPACLISPIIINFSGVLWKDIDLSFGLFPICSCSRLSLFILDYYCR